MVYEANNVWNNKQKITFFQRSVTLNMQDNTCIYAKNKVDLLKSANVSSIIFGGMFLLETSLIREKEVMSGHANTPNFTFSLAVLISSITSSCSNSANSSPKNHKQKSKGPR